MGVIIRPDDLKSIMAGVYARLEALERTDNAHLTSVMQGIGSCHPSGNLSGAGIMEFPTDGHASFSVFRSTSVLVLCAFTVSFAAAGNVLCGLGIDTTTAYYSAPALVVGTTATAASAVTLFAEAQVAAGTHSASLLGQINAGSGMGIFVGYPGLMQVFQLG
jgi:hypothetical protein